jgi:nucleoside-diphosphate-sugar epimerase
MNLREVKPIILNLANKEIPTQHLDSTKAHELLNWFPKINLEDGLRLTLPWYKALFESGDQYAE